MKKRFLIISLVLAVCLIWSAVPLLASQDEGQAEWQTAYVEPSGTVNLNDQLQDLALSDQDLEVQATGLDRTHLYPESLGLEQRVTDGPMLYPSKGETVDASGANEYPALGSFQQVVKHGLTSGELYSVSNVAEPSIGYTQQKKGFMSYNWGAARSSNGGTVWTKVNPYTTFGIPSGYSFCCDQYVVFDPVYNVHFWLRLVLHPSGGGALVIGVSPNTTSWTMYTFAASTTKLPDFPKMELSHNYLYVTYNEFAPSWTKNYVLRLPLLPMVKGQSFGYNFFTVNDWFNMKVAQNYGHNSTMFMASNIPVTSPANRVRIWTWNEVTSGYSWHTITVNGWGYGGGLNCGCSGGGDPCARSDDRVLGAVVSYNGKFPESGKDQLWLAWASDNFGSYVYPFVYMLQINVSNWTVLDYDYIYNSSYAIIYPALAVNGIGDIGVIFDAVGGSRHTSFGVMILDGNLQDYNAGYGFTTVAAGNQCPTDNKWGDYNDIEPWWRNRFQFVAVGHIRDSSTGSQPWYVRMTNSDNFP